MVTVGAVVSPVKATLAIPVDVSTNEADACIEGLDSLATMAWDPVAPALRAIGTDPLQVNVPEEVAGPEQTPTLAGVVSPVV